MVETAQIHVRASTVRAWTSSPRFLDGPPAHGAFLLQVVMDPPFSIRVEDHAPLTLAAVTSGSVAIEHDTARSRPSGWRRRPGPGARPVHDVRRARPGPQILAIPGGQCTTPRA